jgi:nucleotidyltransferase substrate binding protein (TIGR01987 family)
MNERALEHLFDDLRRSLDRLAEALNVAAKEPLAIDGTIQRFEFTFELFWKAVRRLLADQGVEANSPKAVLQQAYRIGWLDGERTWLTLLEDRNLTSHTCREALAREIYSHIPAHHAAMREAVQKLRATL